jgi:hypothetical protein
MAGIILLGAPTTLLAQRGGGGGGGGAGGGRNSTPVICVHDCRTPQGGLNSEDNLKDFRRALALQASAEQRAAFAKVAQYTQTASDQIKDFQQALQKPPASSTLADRATAVDQAIARARAGNQNFLTSFSDAQKSGLEDLTKKLAKADSELDKQLKTLDDAVQAPKPATEQVAGSASALEREVANFQNEQLALGREMGILLSAEGLAFNLPTVTNSINVDGQPVSIPVTGTASRRSVGSGLNVFSVQLTSDLSEFQLNLTGILRSELSRSPRCGERIEVQEATLAPQAPACLVVTSLHYERWACPFGSGQATPTEVADANATLEVKLTPSVQNNSWTLTSEITRVDAEGFLRASLRTGDLGKDLRDQIAAALLSALQKATDTKATLPAAAQQAATIQKVEFQDAGADQLTLVIEGQLQLSEDQTKQLATQLKQNETARAPSQ